MVTHEATIVARERLLVEKQAGAEAQMNDLQQKLAAVEGARVAIAGRCERMSQSFSWRATAPLRWLRRQLLD